MNWSYLRRQYRNPDLFAAYGERKPSYICFAEECPIDAQLKPLFTDADFKEASLLLFRESFGTLAKERLDAATALKKTTFTGRGATQGFQKSHSQRYQGHGGGSQSSGYRGGNKGWAPAGNKATKGQKK